MNITMISGIVLEYLQRWKEELPPEEVNTTPLPVIVAPPMWVAKFKEGAGVAADDYVQVWNCDVLADSNAQAPLLVRHDGKTIALDSTWGHQEAALSKAIQKRERRDAKRAREARNRG